MISNKFVYSIIACLITLFLIVLMVLPNLNVEAKHDEFSYETKLFNEKKVTTINIEIDEKDWAGMMENPTAEEIKEATVTVNGKRINNIGIRTKGNSSLTSVASSDSKRFSLKLDFDYYDSSQSIYGLKKLNLNNNFSDTTQMKEYVSYEILESMGLSTPEHSYMNVTVNGEDYGLMLGVEAVDETFLAKNYGSNDGFLFKPDGTGSDLKYISSDIDDYSGLNPKTNESNIDQSNILDMIDVINNGGDIEEYIDVDNMLRYFATTTALVSMDSYQGMLKHNYYLYEEDGKFSIIPWDYNMAFGSFSMGGMGSKGMQMPEGMDPSKLGNMDVSKEEMKLPEGQKSSKGFEGGNMLDAMTNQDIMSEESINFDISNPVSGTTIEDRPLLNALLKNKEYLATYEKYLKEISTQYFTEENVSKITKEVSATILTYVEADPSKFGTTEQFLEGVSGEKSLAAFAGARSDSILKQLSGELVIDKKPASEEAAAANGTVPSQEQKQTSPKGDDPSGAAEGKEPPEGVELGQMPEGMDPSKMPEGMKPPEGFDPSQMAKGMAPGQMAKGGTADPSVSVRNLALTLGSLLILLIAIIGVSKFNRRGFR
ncbi:CotH kinase family protein [Peribacillus frigoritolerans]|uniref:CotH kinase family protein n=1 Tax=Peribacillus frigoritolerans TaxID=450367 RepID=UPI002225EB22|nr:CotH kinase family protein [Peribacillus frigoritolerans]UYZ00091.1 CotH kinase family protein [Peribacillus frigoritolerans]